MMSDDLYIQIAAKYPDRAVWIEVSEDGENGALIKYQTHRPVQSLAI
jgi:flavin-binding protein dodecin